MRILVTGSTGYIGKRLIPFLLEEGHHVYAMVRDRMRAETLYGREKQITVIEADLLNYDSLEALPQDIDVAYYLVHSMSNSKQAFDILEKQCAENFKKRLEQTAVQQVIYLSGITNADNMSKHLKSRHQVEQLLNSTSYALTTLRAGIIVGSGSASFEIIRDLVEKLPVMIAPKWLNTKTQPIAIRDVLLFLNRVKLNPKTYNRSFDICGPEILTYKDMLLQLAEVRGLKRYILTVPVMTPKLSSYWLYFVTSTSFKLASALVSSLGVEIIAKPSEINTLLDIDPITYKEAVARAFEKIEQNSILSSWKDSFISGRLKKSAHKYINVPHYGCFKDHKERHVQDTNKTLEKIWSIGGTNGWYYGTILWRIRGYMDKLFGGIGLRRGRTHPNKLNSGDALDFWRVIYANKKNKRLLLYAEMRLPGEAWLEFQVKQGKVIQTATFRPKGIAGRLYWYALTPFHWFVFNGMINQLAKG